eukprot:scaffold262552_cov31-Tisochrysis_lutea.AAC.1
MANPLPSRTEQQLDDSPIVSPFPTATLRWGSRPVLARCFALSSARCLKRSMAACTEASSTGAMVPACCTQSNICWGMAATPPNFCMAQTSPY